MNLKHTIAAAVMAVVASSTFAATQNLDTATGYLNGSGTLTYGFSIGAGYDNVLLSLTFSNDFGNPLGITGVASDFGLFSFNGSNKYSYNGSISGGAHTVSIAYSGSNGTDYTIKGFESGGTINSGTTQSVTSTGPAVTAVPEPETYAMMLAGLGALGFLGRRRKTA
jgi:hypothetical protein